PYVGVYDITIFDAPQAGDVPLRLTINKENSSYSSSFENKAGSQLAEMGIEWEVDSTSVEDGMVRIEGYVSTYEVYFELNIDGDDISGSLAGMFDVEGVRVDKP
ncbi:MAG: hypothetical protein CMC03_04595, partial [Flavobacteriaceae bacterium]|nr:hypothetical protein [Flavobacteriaceae bacterium]